LIIKGFKGLLGFLTVIPAGMEPIELISEYFFLCPLVGLIIGSVAGAVGWASAVLLPQVIAGFLVLTVTQLLIGFHHFDGLLDFSDAVMVRGEPSKRLEVMHDKYTGAAAVATGFIVLIVTGLSFGYFAGIEILKAAIVSEIMAKESMVLAAYFGRIPSYEGMGKRVVESMKNKPIKLLFSLVLCAVVVFLLVNIYFIYVFIAMVVTAAILSTYANKAFGCVTGDILGATNEINRMISLLVLLATVS
jgi:adenosylcobinamide-GDP ribazoletransferase